MGMIMPLVLTVTLILIPLSQVSMLIESVQLMFPPSMMGSGREEPGEVALR